MKNTFKMGLKIFGKVFLANTLCIITVISLTFITSALFTEKIGYKVFEVKENEETVLLYEHYYDDGEDTQLEALEESGKNLTSYSIRSEVSNSGEAFLMITSIIFCITLGAIMVYQYVWKEGNKDFNLVKFGHIKGDSLKGLKIGMIASAPYLAFIIILAIGKYSFAKNFSVVLYQFINSVFYGLMELISGNATLFGELAIWQIILFILIILLIPAYCTFAYYMGYNDILVVEKFIYKKVKK